MNFMGSVSLKICTSRLFLVALIFFTPVNLTSCSKPSLVPNKEIQTNSADPANDKIEQQRADQETNVKSEEKSVTNSSTSSEQTAVTLYDFRSQPYDAPLQKISEAEQNVVWKYVYGSTRKRELDEFVSQRISGSFTTANAKETLYVVKGDKAGNEGGRDTTLAIYNGTTPVGKFVVDCESVLKVLDVDSNGQSELLITSGDISNGGSELNAEIIQIDNGQAKTIKKFPAVFSSIESIDHRNTSADVLVISYVPIPSNFPAKYTLIKYSCSGSEGGVNPKTCRLEKSR